MTNNTNNITALRSGMIGALSGFIAACIVVLPGMFIYSLVRELYTFTDLLPVAAIMIAISTVFHGLYFGIAWLFIKKK